MKKIDTKAMREKILDLAIRGKLVPQDPNDEPASVLLENIKQEKEQLVKDKVIKKTKPLAPITKEEQPFNIPKNWEWVRLGEICNVINPTSVNPSDISKNSLLIELKDIEKETGNILSYQVVDTHTDIKSNKYYFKSGDILFNKLRPYLKKILQVSYDGYCSTEFIPISTYVTNMSRYILYTLKSKYINSLVEKSTYGVNLPRVKPAFMNSIILPLPPLSEQQRIVSKIEKLFAELDKIDEAQEKYDSAANKLRDKVLDAAMRGKLVPQDPNDEPAEELLKRIEEEKNQLIEQKVIPSNWICVPLNYVTNILGGYAFKSKNYTPTGHRVIRISDFGETLIDNNKVYYSYNQSLQKYLLKNEDILIAMTGGTVGKSILLQNIQEPMLLNQRVGRVRVISAVIPEFLILFFKSSIFRKKVNQSKNSMNENISLKFLNNCEILIPPLKEQNRIITLVDQVMDVL